MTRRTPGFETRVGSLSLSTSRCVPRPGLFGSWELSLWEGGERRWSRRCGWPEEEARAAWLESSGWAVVLLGPQAPLSRSRPHRLVAVTPSGERGPIVPLTRLEAELIRPASGARCLEFALVGFAELEGRPCFTIRTAPGPRLLFDLERGERIPTGSLEDALAEHELRLARAQLARAGQIEELDLAEQRLLGAATLLIAERGLREACPELRRLEWGSALGCPTLRGDRPVDPRVAQVFELRRLAQRALLLLGEEPRPLPGARVLGRVWAHYPASLEERAEAALGLTPGLSPRQVLQRAGHPDDVWGECWDYLLRGDEPQTLRLRWEPERILRPARLASLERLEPLAGITRCGAFRRPLLGGEPLADLLTCP